MEEQKILQRSGKVYHFIPAERNDTVRITGRHKYLPINICRNEGENSEQIPRITVKTLDRKKRGVFSNLRALHNIAKLEDLDLEDVAEQKKISGFTDGLLKAGEKLLDGSPSGFFIEMLKTIAKPVYNWVIGTDNDQVMEKFTKRILPETQF